MEHAVHRTGQGPPGGADGGQHQQAHPPQPLHQVGGRQPPRRRLDGAQVFSCLRVAAVEQILEPGDVLGVLMHAKNLPSLAGGVTKERAPSQCQGCVPLAVTDTGGPGIPVVYLNGRFATQPRWRRVIAELGPEGSRHITYDERARGKSRRSADYSFEAAVRDVDAVLAARGVERALLVGWSYGAYLAAHWVSRTPA